MKPAALPDPYARRKPTGARSASLKAAYVNTTKPEMPGLKGQEALNLMAAAADLSLLVGADGRVQHVTTHPDVELSIPVQSWVGRPWLDLVTLESRPKVHDLVRSAQEGAASRWRHINFPAGDGPDLPLMCTAVKVGDEGQIVAIARDLRPSSALQQRLLDAQQAMERDYMRLRHLEARYRVLFDMAREAVLLVDAAPMRVVEANPAALTLVGDATRRVVGRSVLDCFADDSRATVESLLTTVRASGRPEAARVRLSVGGTELELAASLFRQESGTHFLLRLSASGDTQLQGRNGAPSRESLAMQALDNAPDGFVLTDLDGMVLHANPAFIEQAEVPHRDQIIGQSLDRWLGRSGVDLRVLIANLRQRGSVRMFATTLRGVAGTVTQVEISGVAVQHGELPCLGFMVRDIGRRLPEPSGQNGRDLPRSVTQLTELVGRVPLKRIVSETTDLIEQLCIEAALELTQDNRASAAEMLGLSRQSLYVKLRRFGMIDAGTGEEPEST